MNRIAPLLIVAALGLTACTDQPAPEPRPTATVEQTATSDAAEALPSEERIAEAIIKVLEAPDSAELSEGAAAVEEFETALSVDTAQQEDDETAQECTAAFEIQPEIAGYGEVAEQDHITSLAAFGFAAPAEAREVTEQLTQLVEACSDGGYELEALTHHTDEAFQIQVAQTEDEVSSVVIVRNTNWVFAVATTPGRDVGLALTLVDQLDEMLR